MKCLLPPNALNQDQQISLRLKDTYGQGFSLEIISDATFSIEPHLHFNYLLDISLAEVLGYDLGSLLDDFGDMQTPMIYLFPLHRFGNLICTDWAYIIMIADKITGSLKTRISKSV